MSYRLGVLLGDGIGPEIVPASVRVVDAALAAAGAEPVAWQELPLGASAIDTHGGGHDLGADAVAEHHAESVGTGRGHGSPTRMPAR